MSEIKISNEARDGAVKSAKHFGMYDPIHHAELTSKVLKPLEEYFQLAIDSATEELNKEAEEWKQWHNLALELQEENRKLKEAITGLRGVLHNIRLSASTMIAMPKEDQEMISNALSSTPQDFSKMFMRRDEHKKNVKKAFEEGMRWAGPSGDGWIKSLAKQELEEK